ncbi:MAG: two component, sigma54 specific, transcriptional regulator, Fis family [Marmoricola sp.]|nr:two component, sigma54 specific, transcriptional regulator, Fis family [Marmoricola sp.]
MTPTDSDVPAPRILLVDDEPDIRGLARLILEMNGLVVDEAADGTQALARFDELNPPPDPAAVVLDNRMPGLSGVEVAAKMLSINPAQVIVLFTAHLDRATEDAAKAVGVTACVSKTEIRRLAQILRELMPAA